MSPVNPFINIDALATNFIQLFIKKEEKAASMLVPSTKDRRDSRDERTPQLLSLLNHHPNNKGHSALNS